MKFTRENKEKLSEKQLDLIDLIDGVLEAFPKKIDDDEIEEVLSFMADRHSVFMTGR